MKKALLTTIAIIICVALPIGANAANGVSGGVTILKETSARALGLAGAIQTLPDEITALNYNPASLNSLTRGDVAFLYENGITDDSFSQLTAGTPWRDGAFGLSCAYYNGGKFNYNDGVNAREVDAQKDVLASAAYARRVRDVSAGITLKYISSELFQLASAQTMALDLGLMAEPIQRLRVGAALQNLGGKLTYREEGDALPSTFRLGSSYLMPTQYPTMLLLDFPYLINERDLSVALGVETRLPLMLIRWGYQSGVELGGFSFGLGLNLGRVRLDYAFGLMREVNSRHHVSLSLRFGPEKSMMNPTDNGLKAVELKGMEQDNWRRRRVSQTGDSTNSPIADKKQLDEKQSAGEELK